MYINTIIGFTALIVGLCIGIFVKKNEITKLETENQDLKKNNIEKNETIQNLTNTITRKETELNLLQDIRKLIQEDFTLIASKVIKEEQSDLRQQNKETIEEKLKPLRENFREFKEKVEEFNTREAERTVEIKTQIKNLIDESKTIQTTANNLSNAIKNNAKARGDFGEMILENLLKQAGLINKRDNEEKGNYITQKRYTDMSGESGVQIPDAIVFFPDNKHIVIDSKCPLNNFYEYCNAEEENERKNQLNSFYNSVENMINDLSTKYNQIEKLNTPEFKLMFIPLESCASYIYQETTLLNKAAKKNIIIVCPSTLLATLKIINKIWQNKAQSENFENILKTVQGIYEKIAIFIEKAEIIQNKIKAADNSFDELFKTAQGRGGILPQIEKLQNCGIKSTKKIDEKYFQEEMI